MLAARAVQIVDVLPSHEYRRTHIRGAIHLPVGRILLDAPNLLDSNCPVVAYCRDSL